VALSRISVLISGRGSNLAALVHAARRGEIDGSVTRVRTTMPQAPPSRAARHRDPTVDHREHATRDAFDLALADAIDTGEPDVMRAGFMRVLGGAFVPLRGG
jgi:phosphoribosylglycinamide formyltransferase-1